MATAQGNAERNGIEEMQQLFVGFIILTEYKR